MGYRSAPETGLKSIAWSQAIQGRQYERWGLIVELDGREAHPADEAFRDMRRDNETTLSGRTTLRYGWRDVVGEPCVAAGQVALARQQRGWPGSLRRCGANCSIPPPAIVG